MMKNRMETVVFEFDYTVSEQDYIEFNRYHMQKSPAGKRSRSVVLLMMLAAFLIVLVVNLSSDGFEGSIPVLIIFGLAGLFMLLQMGPMMRWNAKMSIKFMKKSGRLPYDNQVNLRVENDFIIEKTPMTEIKTMYPKLERIAVGPFGVYLYTSAISAILIPNTVFSNAAQKYDFLQLINQKTNLPIEGIM